MFDSSPPPSQAAKSESANTNAAFGTESSFDFGSLSTTSAGGSTTTGVPSGVNNPGTAPQQLKTPNPPDHDWDAIFASLDDAPPAATSPTGAVAVNGSGNAQEQANEQARPAPGRALTEDGKNDDPLLKDLTGMGYSRTDALSALEKYNYNLDRVSFP